MSFPVISPYHQAVLARKPIAILIQRADRVGDTLFTFPLVDALRALFPLAHIDYLVSQSGALVTPLHPDIRHAHVISPTISKQALARVLPDIVATQYDLYFSLFNHPLLRAFEKNLDIPIKVAAAAKGTTIAGFTHQVPARLRDLSQHAVEDNLRMLTVFGQQPTLKPHTQCPTTYHTNSWFKRTQQYKKTGVLFTETGGSNHPLPSQSVVSFIQHAAQHDPQLHLFLLGNQPHNPLRHITGHTVTNAICNTSFNDIVALIAGCTVYIGPDTGATHVAAFFNKPVVFFSPMKMNWPAKYGVFSTKQRIIRNDTSFPYWHLTPATKRKQLAFLTGSFLYQAYRSVLSSDSVLTTLENQRMYHYVCSFRALYRPYPHDKKSSKAQIASLRQQGIHIYTLTQRWWRCLYQIKHRNINILHGHWPWYLRWLIRFYMDTVVVVYVPIYTPQALEHTITPAALINHYVACFKKT